MNDHPPCGSVERCLELVTEKKAMARRDIVALFGTIGLAMILIIMAYFKLAETQRIIIEQWEQEKIIWETKLRTEPEQVAKIATENNEMLRVLTTELIK